MRVVRACHKKGGTAARHVVYLHKCLTLRLLTALEGPLAVPSFPGCQVREAMAKMEEFELQQKQQQEAEAEGARKMAAAV